MERSATGKMVAADAADKLPNLFDLLELANKAATFSGPCVGDDLGAALAGPCVGDDADSLGPCVGDDEQLTSLA